MVWSACAHKGRLVVFLASDRAFERDIDGSWSPYEVAAGELGHNDRGVDLAESVILG